MRPKLFSLNNSYAKEFYIPAIAWNSYSYSQEAAAT